MSAIVLRPNQEPQTVKNLGWLIRNWQGIEYMGFNYYPDSKNMIDGELIAKFRNGTTYLTDYASLSVCWDWLNRPIFQGLPFRLVRPNQTDNNRQDFTIGDAEWKRINRLEYAQFQKELSL